MDKSPLFSKASVTFTNLPQPSVAAIMEKRKLSRKNRGSIVNGIENYIREAYRKKNLS
jgi:hypothetical protein